jgi:hypothetical protein
VLFDFTTRLIIYSEILMYMTGGSLENFYPLSFSYILYLNAISSQQFELIPQEALQA